ncbi:unnamed protein product [Symbiodinium sp. KB8]|nr:unnamed protein product [Symbiodinium sp. KB8]
MAASAPPAPAVVVIDEDVKKRFKDLKLKRKHKYLVLKLEEGETLKVTVEKVGKASATADEFQSDLSSSECRYAVYDHEDTLPDGRKKSKLLFILWAHSRARPSSCMTYTSRKNAVSSALEGVFDVTARNEDELLELLGLKVDDEDSEEWDPDA